MLVYLVMTIITVVFAWFVSSQSKNNGNVSNANGYTKSQMSNQIILLAIFMMLFFVAALRINVGNDYREYLEIFDSVLLGKKVSTEFGFNIIVHVFSFFFGGTAPYFIFAFFSGLTIYFMIRTLYEQSEWFFFSFFLFMMSGYYFSSLNTVRYYFAFAIAMYAAKYAIKKDWIPFLLWILLAATVHKTVLVVIPIYWFAARKWSKIEIGLIVAGCASFILFQDVFRKIIFTIYPYYEGSLFDTGRISYINILKCLAVLIFAILYYKKSIRDCDRNQFYFQLNIGALLLYVFGSFIPEVSRIGYYLVGCQTILVGNVLTKIEKKWQKVFFGVAIAVAFLFYFIIFMKRASGESLRIVPYQTFIW